jgi:hypothetical protein
MAEVPDRSNAAIPVSFGGPASAAWREEALTKVEELDGLQKWILARNGSATADSALAESIERHLVAARETAGDRDRDHGRVHSLVAKARGSSVERTLGNLDAVEADLLRLAPLEYVRGQMPSLLAHIRRFLPKDDPRRLRTEHIASDVAEHLGETERTTVIAAYHAANSQRRRELIRVRSFRNVILMTSGILMLIAVAMAVLGAARPDAAPLCFKPKTILVCPVGDHPTSTDIWLIEVIGLVAAAVGGAVSLRNIRGTSTPYSLPVALAVLKLPTGALTAVLGLLLMRGQFVPGLSALDNPAQIVSWAIVFGSAQQLFTRLIDAQANAVLQDVGGHGAGGDRPKNSQ